MTWDRLGGRGRRDASDAVHGPVRMPRHRRRLFTVGPVAQEWRHALVPADLRGERDEVVGARGTVAVPLNPRPFELVERRCPDLLPKGVEDERATVVVLEARELGDAAALGKRDGSGPLAP